MSSVGKKIVHDFFIARRVMAKLSLFVGSGDNFFFYLDFLSQLFTNHRTAGEGGGHFFNCSLPLPPASQALRH